MTINEFSDKYGIDRSTVYHSTWECKRLPGPTRGRNFDYAEEDLLAGVRKLAVQRRDMYQALADRAREILQKINT